MIDSLEIKVDVNLPIFIVEYPYVVPQPAENIRSSSPEPIGSVTTSIKAIKLNIAKAFEGQGNYSTTNYD